MAVSILSCSTLFDEAAGRECTSTYSSARKSQSRFGGNGEVWSRLIEPRYLKGSAITPAARRAYGLRAREREGDSRFVRLDRRC